MGSASDRFDILIHKEPRSDVDAAESILTAVEALVVSKGTPIESQQM